MTQESSIKIIPYSQETVYDKLSNLENVEKVVERIPKEHLDKIKDFSFERDSISISVPQIGNITLSIIERDEPKTIKFETLSFPMKVNLWIQLLPVTPISCKMKLTLKADIPSFMASMIEGKIKEAIDQVASFLAIIPYE